MREDERAAEMKDARGRQYQITTSTQSQILNVATYMLLFTGVDFRALSQSLILFQLTFLQ